MRDAANEIKAARKRPEVEAAAARRLAEEEEAIARKYDMLPDWSGRRIQQGLLQGACAATALKTA